MNMANIWRPSIFHINLRHLGYFLAFLSFWPILWLLRNLHVDHIWCQPKLLEYLDNGASVLESIYLWRFDRSLSLLQSSRGEKCPTIWRKIILIMNQHCFSTLVDNAQCGNLRIFLPFRFYVKSKLVVLKIAILTI